MVTNDKAQSHVWLVEVETAKGCGVFTPVACAQPSRSEARREMNFYWRNNYPDHKFRVVKYVRESEVKTKKEKVQQ
jgi:hypothetical protein